MKMGRPKKYDRRTINFGSRGHAAREIVELYIKKNGSNELSKLIRKLLLFYFRDDPAYQDVKTRMALAKHREILDRFMTIQKEILASREYFDSQGIDLDKLLEV